MNVSYSETGPRTRDGFSSTVLVVTGAIRTMLNWVTTDAGAGRLNRLLYYDGTMLRMRDLINGVTVDLYSLAGSSASIAEAGARLYSAIIAANGTGAGEVRIIHPLIGGSPADKAFGGPVMVTPVIFDAGAGQCTVGTKKFAFIKETRSGFRGRPGTEITYTVSSGGRALQMVVLGDTPADAAWYHPIMTTTANQDRWFFVPDAQVGVPAGVPGWLAIMDINVSDDTLTRVGVEATAYFDKLSQSGAGTGPFSPIAVLSAWRRLAYILNDKAYFSDIDDYESISEDQHVIYLPGKREIRGGFMQRGAFYMVGPGWTYGYPENTETPSEWPAPATVSEALGAPAQTCICPRTSGEWVWIANPSGLYVFSGQYGELPISWFDQDWWARINWTDPSKIIVKDDVESRIVMVLCPLDGATEPNYFLTWGYSNPPSPSDVDFAPYSFAFGSAYSIETMIDPVTTKVITLLAKSGKILKQVKGTYIDDGLGIDSYTRSSYLLTSGDSSSWPVRCAAFDLGILGEGRCEVEVRSKGNQAIKRPSPIYLERNPTREYHRKADLVGNNFDVMVRTSDAGAWFDLSIIRPYWTPWIGQAK